MVEVPTSVVRGDGPEGALESKARVTGELWGGPVALEPGLDL